MPDLVPVHGGLDQPVNCTVPAAEIAAFKAEAAKLTKVPVSDADLSTVYRFGDGALSPLTGPMTSKAYNRVLDESVIETQRQALRLDDSAVAAGHRRPGGQLKAGQKVALTNSAGEIVGTLDIRTSSRGTSRATSRASTSPSGPITPAPTWCSRGTPTRRT